MEWLTPEEARQLGADARERRLAARLTQTALAREVGVSFAFVSKVERGRMRRYTTDLFGLLDYLGLGDGEEGDRPVTTPVTFHSRAPASRRDYVLDLTTTDDVSRLADAKVFEIVLKGAATSTSKVRDERWEKLVRCRIDYPIHVTVRILPGT